MIKPFILLVSIISILVLIGIGLQHKFSAISDESLQSLEPTMHLSHDVNLYFENQIRP